MPDSNQQHTPPMRVILFSGSLQCATAQAELVEAATYIPEGPYCYSISRTRGCCPFWQRRAGQLEQEDGYCHYLRHGDWQEPDSLSLLWDQVKECGIGDDWQPDA